MTSVYAEKPVLVGVDGSDSSLAALDWAAAEALAGHRVLRIVHAFVWPSFPHVSLGPTAYGPPNGGLRNEAERIVETAVRRAATGAPGLAVEGKVYPGAAVPVMLAAAETAELVVVGSRGLGGFASLLVGSVSSQLATHATCPVVVTRAPEALPPDGVDRRRVLVGIEDPTDAEDTLGFAFDEAERLSAGVNVVHCLPQPPLIYGVPFDDADIVAAHRRLLDEAVVVWQGKYPDIEVEAQLVRGSPAHALITGSRQALLVVVGSRGGGGFRGLLLGSVSQQVLHHSAATVAIVHPSRAE